MRKKLIEVAIPVESISEECKSDMNPFLKYHPRSLHLWWARRPLAAARAVVFSQLVDDPSSCPEEFPTEEAQDKERQRLFRLIEELVKWENTTNEKVLQKARDEIWRSWRRTCRDNKDHPQGDELYNPDKLPAFHDPFAGGGALPLEAQRLGLEAFASDLNPVAVLINKAMIEIPPKFVNRPPVRQEAHKNRSLIQKEWKGTEGLSEDIRYYGKWVRDEVEKSLGDLFPKVKISSEMLAQRPDLEGYLGKQLTVTTWLWARTVRSPNPAFSESYVPLIASYYLSKKKNIVYLKPIIDGMEYRFKVIYGTPANSKEVLKGTKTGGSGSSFKCILSGTPIPFDYIRSEAKAGRMKQKLIAMVVSDGSRKIYIESNVEHETAAECTSNAKTVDANLPRKALGFRIQEYGMSNWRDLYTSRQYYFLSTLVEVVKKIPQKIITDIKENKWDIENDVNPQEYAYSVLTYIACGISQLTRYYCTICTWNSTNQNVAQAFGRQAIPMVWDFAEANPLYSSLGIEKTISWVADSIKTNMPYSVGYSLQRDASKQEISENKIISTDPPYYDNIGYADLSDFFYVWLRQVLLDSYPDLFATISVPKSDELVANPYRHHNKEGAKKFFLSGMTEALSRIAELHHSAYPISVFYAFKQTEMKNMDVASTGWEIFLEAIKNSKLTISGTWPLRTERTKGLKSKANTLASSVVVTCRKRSRDTLTISRREFIKELSNHMRHSIDLFQSSNIAPVDIAQAAIGPGMYIYTKYSDVVDAQGNPLSVRAALELINKILDEIQAKQEGNFDSQTRWAIAWFDQFGFEEGDYGEAEKISKAKNTSVDKIANTGVIKSQQGIVRLVKPNELSSLWNPVAIDTTIWEVVHQLIRSLECDGESETADIVKKLGSKAEEARELAYRLYTICERKRRTAEALSYNSLVQSWPEILRLAKVISRSAIEQGNLFDSDGE